MAGDFQRDKFALTAADPLPRMVGDSDLRLLRAQAELLPEGATVLEIGPWLGGVTQVLSEYGTVHVVDRFEWSRGDARQFPGVFEPGDDFRPLFDALMSERDLTPRVFAGLYEDFVWEQDTQIDLVFIDAPRDAEGALHCFRILHEPLAEGATVLFKNGLSVLYPELVAIFEALAGLGVVDIPPSDQPPWCSTLMLRRGPNWNFIPDLDANDLLHDAPLANMVLDPWGGRLLTAARFADRILSGNTDKAMELLHAASPDPQLLHDWDVYEARLGDVEQDDFLTVFTEFLSAQVDGLDDMGDAPKSLALALRAWWMTAHWRGDGADRLDPDRLAIAQDKGSLIWPSRLHEQLRGKFVVEIGSLLGVSGIGARALGASGYLGLSTGKIDLEMIRTESAFPGVTYMSCGEFRDDQMKPDGICLVHESAVSDYRLPGAIERIRAIMGAETPILVLPQSSDEATKYLG